ncbi:MAG: hypothetical protein AAGM33_12130, partial [Pseudomonadota bacterium]
MEQFGLIFSTAPTLVTWILIYIVAQRLGELVYANRNTKRLLAEGGEEFGADHYHWFIFLHSAWLAMIFLMANPTRPVALLMLALFVGTQILRIWTLAS